MAVLCHLQVITSFGMPKWVPGLRAQNSCLWGGVYQRLFFFMPAESL